MSSVTRFIRQIPVSTTYYDATNAVTNAYAFIPTPANYVGNYPPGGVVLASTATITAGQNLYGELSTAPTVSATNSVVRDLGKTIYAEILTATGVSSTTPQFGYFREVQVLRPQPIGLTSNTIIGGTTGSTFGVGGASPNYLTFYIPVTVAGVRNPATAPNFYAIAGGQM